MKMNSIGYKAAYEGAILVKDKEWSQKLAKYSAMLPDAAETASR